MKLKLSLVSGQELTDLAVTVDAGASAGQLAERLHSSHPRPSSATAPGPDLGFWVNPGMQGERRVAPTLTMADAGVHSGDVIMLTNAASTADGRTQTAATLSVTSGPDAGQSFSLPVGTSVIGRDRDCDVRLSDPLVSKRHVKVTISDMVEIIDDNSANGTLVNEELAQRAVVRADDRVVIGDTELAFSVHAVAAGAFLGGGPTIEFNRSPRLDPRYPGVELVAPEPPDRPEPRRFPWITIVAPILMGAIMYSITRNILSILFVGLSPIMIIGAFFEARRSSKKAMKQGAAQFRTALRELAVQLQYAGETERVSRRREHPSIEEVVGAVHDLSPLLWTRRPEHESFRQIRLGLGLRPSRNKVKTPEKNKTLPELWRELQSVVSEFSVVDRVPVVADLAESGNIGIGGPAAASHPLAAGVVAQFVGLHSPAELVLGAITTPGSARRWEWLKWLPHSGSEYSPVVGEHLASNVSQVNRLVSEVEELVRQREQSESGGGSLPVPVMVLIVEDDAAQDRARLVQLAERGPRHGIHLLWVAASLQRLPAACRTYLEVDPTDGSGAAGYVHTGEGVTPVELEPLEAQASLSFAKALAPVVDSGAYLEDQHNLPRSVSFLSIAGPELADSPAEIIERWRGTNSLPQPGAPRLKRDSTLRALVGQAAGDRCYLDLRSNGPHALVGGTTGSGKSEFLQTWLLGMASAHSPARVNFLLVDYKGGSAFADCVELPHCVGMVTDLSQHLVRRALTSLRAELRRREQILNGRRAKDLLEMEKNRYPETPPSLVIVVDEFAALVGEVPEFVDGVVDVAQRGRSLGIHLVLATQRPSGVITGSLRANTNLRVALRIADEDDSKDVVGSAVAASFDPSIPGRGVAKTGPGRLLGFQAGYVGGHTTSQPPPPVISVFEMPFGLGREWDEPEVDAVSHRSEDQGPTDIRRLVDTISVASEMAALPGARQPWLPELSATYRLEDLPSPRTDEKLVFGVVDRPESQDQPVIAFEPDVHGNMAVFGTGGSGKSAFLRSLAVAAGFAPARGGPCQVYGLDFGGRGLSMLEVLPHVGAVINAEDTERTSRLLKQLRATIDERAARYAAVNAGTISAYRERSGNRLEARILLLIDNFSAFRQMYELGRPGNPFDLLEGIAADGRAVGVHLVATADQANAFPTSLRSVIQSQVALRLVAEMDLMTLGVPLGIFDAQTPPGRGFFDGNDVQVAVLGGDQNMALQAGAMQQLAEAMERVGIAQAPSIAHLADHIRFDSVIQQVGANPVLGVWDETLEPLRFEPVGIFTVSGPPRSGKTSTIVSMLASIRTVRPVSQVVRFGPSRSPLAGLGGWESQASDPEQVAKVAADLTDAIKARSPDVDHLVVVIEGIGEYTSSSADDALQGLLRAVRTEAKFALIEGESTEFNGNWGLMSAVKPDRTGIALQPDQMDGDIVLGTEFPRVRRVEFPPGRGLYARSGQAYRVQVLAPDEL